MKRGFHGYAGATLALILATPAFAQTPGATAEADTEISDIVVTAQRRGELLQDVPISIAAITGDTLQGAGAMKTADLALVSPSLNISSGLGYIKPFIRGVGSTANGAGIENPVAIYIDGVYIANGPGGLFQFNNLERIEILNGPQGTLFGRNATGGLINVITRDPRQRTELEVSATVANYETIEGNIYAAGGITPDVAAGVAFQYRHQGDGWGTNTVTGKNTYDAKYDYNGRVKLVGEFGSTVIHLSGDYTKHNISASTLGPAPGTRPNFAAARITRPSYDVALDLDVVNLLEGGGGSLRIDHDFGGVTLMSLSALRRQRYAFGVDFDLTPLSVLNAFPAIQNDRQLTQEIQLQSPGSQRFTWTLGFYYFDSKASLYQVLDFGGPLSAPNPITGALGTDKITVDGNQTGRSYAGYAQATYAITDTTNFTGGFRYTWEERGLNGRRTLTNTAGTNFSLPFRNGDRLNFKRPTWRLSLDQKLAEDVMIYGSYNRGFKSGGYNLSVPADPGYLPEQIDAYEIGLKTTLFDRKLRLNAAGFYYDYSNIQVARFAGGSIGIYNGAKARLYGGEINANAVLGPNFKLDAAISYINTKFLSFREAVVTRVQPDGSALQLTNQDVSGNRTPNSPKLSASLGADVHFPMAGGSEIGGNVTYLYNDGFFTEPDNIQRQPAYHLVNASVRWHSPNERYRIEFWGRNLLSQFVATQLQSSNISVAANFQAPLTFGATVGFKY